MQYDLTLPAKQPSIGAKLRALLWDICDRQPRLLNQPVCIKFGISRHKKDMTPVAANTMSLSWPDRYYRVEEP